MTRQFKNIRLGSHIFVFVFSVVVLGIGSNLASLFVPRFNEGFFITAVVVPALTILVLLLILSYSQARTELFLLILLAIAWTVLGAWATDVIGHVQCSNIASSDRLAAKNGRTTSARSYCNQVKVIEAFSWMNMALFTLSSLLLITLASRARGMGRPWVWSEPVADLPWFGERPGEDYDEEGRLVLDPRYGAPPPSFLPQQTVTPNGTVLRVTDEPRSPLLNGGPLVSAGSVVSNGGAAPFVVQQQPGHAVVIQGGRHGQPAVSQIPSVVPR